jgi:hypothetical protein
MLDAAVRRLVLGLAAYLHANPHACDTPEGIGTWWLGDQPDPLALQQALDFMVQSALLACLPAIDGRARYRRLSSEPGFDTQVQAALAFSSAGLRH